MRAIVGILLATLALGRVAALHAQDPLTSRPPDSLRADSARLRDTVSTTDRLLAAQKEQRIFLPAMPRCGVASLEPSSTRVVFTRDSIDWAAAESVSELLQRIPGVFLHRSDFMGSPELLDYFGRGAASVLYTIDCVPVLPLGVDSVAFDPATLPLGLYDRVEAELAPGFLRVFLFTHRQVRADTRTKIGASQGDRGFSRYAGYFERRYSSGIGIAIGANYISVNPPPSGTGGVNIPGAWLQLSYVPSYRFGVQGQFVSNAITRNVLLDDITSDTLTRAVMGTRTDAQLRLALRAREDGLGPSLDVIAAHAAWNSDSMPGHRSLSQFGAIGAFRHAAWSTQATVWANTSQTPLDVRLQVGWAPEERIAASLELAGQHHQGNRSSSWSIARVGFTLPHGFQVGGSLSDGHRVQSPTLADDVAQRFTDAEVNGSFHSKLLGVDLGYLSNEGWRPQAYAEFVAVPVLGPMPRTNWMTAHVRVTPVGFFTVETVYQNPLAGVIPDGSPPNHMVSTATIRSRFLRNFPSGIFDLKLQAVMEKWGAGIGGRDTTGAAIPLPAATFFRAIIQLQIGPFIAYYDKMNLQATKTGYVPGYRIQPIGSTFGIRWEFSN